MSGIEYTENQVNSIFEYNLDFLMQFLKLLLTQKSHFKRVQ